LLQGGLRVVEWLNTERIQVHDFDFKTTPFEHQSKGFAISRDRIDFALLLEMGTGKTKIILDTAAWLWSLGKINFLLVVAPNDVHKNWARKEIPKHLPDWCDRRVCVWTAVMKVAEWEKYHSLFDPEFKGLRILLVNVEAFSAQQKHWKPPLSKIDKDRPKWGVAARSIINTFDVMGVIDESTRIKTPGIATSRRIRLMRKHLKYSRIMTGTPITNSPLDAYSQFRFLGEKYLGFTNYLSFKMRYGIWERKVIQRRDGRTAKFDELTGYKHLDELKENIAKVSFRVLKKDCLDLPEKTYDRRYVEMTAEQRKIYNRVLEKSLIEIGGKDCSVKNVLVRIIRLQQVLGGFVPEDHDGNTVPIFKDPMKNPRIKSVIALAEDTGLAKMIIWCRFRAEIKAITQCLNHTFGEGKAVSFYGDTGAEERTENLDNFQDTDSGVQWFVSNPHSGGYGLDLTAASFTDYYSNDYSLEVRLQSEDRNHRIGTKNPVTYIDQECLGTIDTAIVEALVKKKNLADLITGDQPARWLKSVAIQE
jgi:SNF2 family DNA or RNA helicase